MPDDASLLSPLPQSVTIPTQLVEAWSRIAPATSLELRISRQDIDHLFFALDNFAHSQDHLVSSLQKAMSGDTVGAEAYMRLSTIRTIEGQNRARQMLISLMASALNIGDASGG